MFLHGCFLLDVLPSEPTKKKRAVINPQEPPPVKPVLPVPGKLAPARLMRRLTIDLAGRLPTQTEIDALVADPTQFVVIADQLVESGAAAINVANLHRRMWELRSDQLPDLDRLIERGDTDLETKLTANVREQITSEPLQYVRFQYENKLPFSDIYTRNFSYNTTELLDLWGTNGDGMAWPGQSWNFAPFVDDRPAAGILASNGMLANIDSREDSGQKHRSYNILRRFNCGSMGNKSAHLFYELTGAELLSDLGTLALNKKACASCHLQIENTAGALQGFAVGATFSAWQTYAAPAEEYSGYYNGQPFTGATGWIAAFSLDSRTHRCEAQKLAGALLQRAYGAFDTETVSIGLTNYYEGKESLIEIVRAIVRSKQYQSDVVNPAVKGEYERSSSGIRTLRRHQWRSIVTSLVPSVADLEFSEALDPGADETLNGDDMVPTGLYWHNVDRLARIVGTRIVAEELADSSVTMNRRLFTILPDGSAFGVATTGVYLQIRLIWQQLTGEALDESSATYTAFQTMWAAAKPEASAEDFRRAWRVVLVAMLTHPQFINY